MVGKATIHKQYNDWLAFIDDVKSSTSHNASESKAEQKARVARLLKNYDQFFAYYFPYFAKVATAPFHVRAARAIKRNPKVRGIFKMFRGAAKSTHLGMGVPIWLMVQDELKFMLLASNTDEAATDLIDSLRGQLAYNKRLQNDFGIEVGHGKWQEGRFTTNKGVTFRSIGLGQSPRGLRYNEHRPDYILVDDADTKERTKNPKRINEAVEWIFDDLMGTMDVGRERFVICNNVIHKHSIITQVEAQLHGKRNPDLYVMQVNAVDSKGRPTWPAKYTAQYWRDKEAGMPYRSFQREYMNNPIEEGSIFKKDWIKYEKVPAKLDHLLCYTDPSFKSGPTADYKASVLLGVVGTRVFLIDCFVRQASITDMVAWHYGLYEQYPTAQFFIEANFIQDMLLDEYREMGNRLGYQLPMRPDKRKKPDKFQRVENISPFIERQFVVINKKIEGNRDWHRALEQLLAFEKGARAADDFPDALEGGLWLIQQHARISRAGAPLLVKRIRKNAY